MFSKFNSEYNPVVNYDGFEVDFKRRIFFSRMQHLPALPLFCPSRTDHFLTIASHVKIERIVLKQEIATGNATN